MTINHEFKTIQEEWEFIEKVLTEACEQQHVDPPRTKRPEGFSAMDWFLREEYGNTPL